MSDNPQTPLQARLARLAENLQERFVELGCELVSGYDELTLVVPSDRLIEVALSLRNETIFGFEELIDVCGVDYSAYGRTEWQTEGAPNTGFSRGVERSEDSTTAGEERFAAVYHLLSVANNQRLRLRVFVNTDNPIVPSVVDVWNGADWFEREAFDLFGILFDGHPDLRRILTDYGFIGHPFRKDFPLIGKVEMRYDPEQGRVIYEPVSSVEPRTLVPRVARNDNRYLHPDAEQQDASDA